MPSGQEQGPQVESKAGFGASEIAKALGDIRGGGRRLSVGRIVHYTNLGDADGKYPPETQPALVVRVNEDGTAGLWVFYPAGTFYMPSVQGEDVTAPSPQRGRWAWPPIV